jgi:hypothetical protein
MFARMMIRPILSAATLALALPVPVQAQGTSGVQQAQPTVDRFARARDNYVALRDGRRAVSELTPEELEDVLELDRRLRGDMPDDRSPKQQCIDNEVRSAGGRPSALAWRVIAMKCRD